MKEPIIRSTANCWPEWHKQPLYLTVAEIENPALVLDHFFDCYHLTDIRTCLNNWLQDALDKPTIESKEHIDTHKEVQKLTEAAWLIHESNTANNKLRVLADGNIVNSQQEDNAEEQFNKPMRLIEKASIDPLLVIDEVFKAESLKLIKEGLGEWLHVGLVSENIKYAFGDQRSNLLQFYNELVLFVEALYIIIEQQQSDKRNTSKTSLPSTEQAANPYAVVTEFFERFPITYIRRELWDWFYATITFPVPGQKTYGLNWCLICTTTCLA